jgi:outer membrane immunogenic protein
MKKVSIAVIGGAAMSIASLAQAADLPYRSAAPGNYDYPPSFTWTGFYAGVNLGGGIGNFSGSGAPYFGSDPSGWLAGFTAGYNYQSGNLLLGGEADYDWSRIASDASVFPGVASTGIVQNMTTIRARFGYAMDRILVYGTGGYAGASVRGVLSNVAQSAFADQSYWANGFALGVGAEYALTPHITAKAEYLYTSLGNSTYFAGTPNVSNVGANLSLLRAGVNYKF